MFFLGVGIQLEHRLWYLCGSDYHINTRIYLLSDG